MTNRTQPLFIAVMLATLTAACNPASHGSSTSVGDVSTTHEASAARQSDDAHRDASKMQDTKATEEHTNILMPPPATRWPTDAPLRKGMEGIAHAVENAQAASRAGEFGPHQAKALADDVNAHFKYMLTNCKLAPEADAVLHSLLAQFVSTSADLEANPATPGALAHLQQLLELYSLYFDHPGWDAGVRRY